MAAAQERTPPKIINSTIKPMKSTLILLIFFLIILTPSESITEPQWQILTKQNFSSQIRLHPHILLIVSNPWSGESRSLMKELSELVKVKEDEFGVLKLMYMHRNKEKMLTDAIGGFDGMITVFYYHYSFRYKYQGRHVAANILNSISPYFNVTSREIPVKTVGTEEELRNFVECTDKAVVLYEFCGWSMKLLDGLSKNGTENGAFVGGTNGIPEARMKVNQKGTETAGSMCSIQDGFIGVPWFGDFSLLNRSDSSLNTGIKDMKYNDGPSSCGYEEFQKFESVFSRFMNVAREFFLLPESYRFGLVSERSLLSSVGVEGNVSWSRMVFFNGCPSCSKILKEEDDLKAVLSTEEPIVSELEANGQDSYPYVPANKPSVILFVDRFSNSSEIKWKSKEALAIFRKLAQNYHISDKMHQQNGGKSERSSAQSYQDYKRTSGHPKLKLSPEAQRLTLKEKMSIMIVNEGNNLILDSLGSNLQGSSFQEILTYLLQQKKERKLSSVAKELGFQLLSDDVDVKILDKVPSDSVEESIQVSSKLSEEPLASTGVNLDKDSALDQNERSQHTDILRTSQDDGEKKSDAVTSSLLPSLDSNQIVPDDELAISNGLEGEGIGSTQVDQLEESQVQFQSFEGSFYFSDGNYRFLKALTGESRIPSLVIIDPIMHKHYVFPELTDFTYASLEDAINKYLNGILIPYQRSEPAPENPWEGTLPPFVTSDFRETGSIPHVTAQTFSEHVLGFSKSDNENDSPAWKEDVLVLFSNSWCGFCQRMELVVREVFRALKEYMNVLKTGSLDGETVLSNENLKNSVLKLPKIFLMDCTLNDCRLILNTTNQREVYPALLLFPAETKSVVPYKGDMAVTNIIRFIAEHGSCSQHLTSNKGIIWPAAKKGGKDHVKDALSSTFSVETASRNDESYEVVLNNRKPKRSVRDSQIKSHTSEGLHDTITSIAVGSILVASEKVTAQPFDNATILIVKVDQNTWFKGLIFNKPIRWDSLNELGNGFELLKEAPLSYGGPLIKPRMPLVALTRQADGEQHPEVASGIYFLDQSATAHRIEQIKSGNLSVVNYWFFLGFSSWSWNQLYNEIDEGSWNVMANNSEIIEWP